MNQSKQYADAPNSPHKKYIFGRLNRYYVDPVRASETVDKHLTPLLEEYTQSSHKAAQYAYLGDYEKFNEYFKVAMSSYQDYNQLLDMLVNSEKYADTVSEWKMKYARALDSMALTDEQREHREAIGVPRVDSSYHFKPFPEDDKQALLEDISKLSEELISSTEYADGGSEKRRRTANYAAILSMAAERGYNGEKSFGDNNRLKRRQKAILASLNMEEIVRRSQEQSAQARKDNQRAWEEYEKSKQDSSDDDSTTFVPPTVKNQPDQQPGEDTSGREDTSGEENTNSTSDTKESVRDHQKNSPFGRQPSPDDVNGDGDPYNDNTGSRDYNTREGDTVIYTKVNGRIHRKVIGKDGTVKGDSTRDVIDSKKGKNKGDYGKFGEKIYGNWNKVPLASKVLSPTSTQMRKRFHIGPIPITVSSGLAGMRHPLDIISNISVGAGGLSYSVYSRDKERGVTYLNIPGGIDFRGRRKKKKDNGEGGFLSRMFGRKRRTSQ